MRYALIDADGEMQIKAGDWRPELGVHGYAQVRLHAVRDRMAGWVSDCGLIMPDVYARNPVGAAMLCSLGANVQPYAGPVVITGWTVSRYEADVAELLDADAAYLPGLHADVRRALSGEPVADDLRGWAESIREVGEVARTGDVPPIRIFGADGEVPQ